jgi:hypothetical protein
MHFRPLRGILTADFSLPFVGVELATGFPDATLTRLKKQEILVP